MLLTKHGVRLLGSDDLSDFRALVERDPVTNVFAGWRARTTNLQPQWLGGEVWGRFERGQLIAACHAATNLVPVNCSPEDALVFGERAGSRRRGCTTITGPQEAVTEIARGIGGRWGQPREQRWDQPHLVISHNSAVAPDPMVRRSTESDFNAIYPACVAMYSEEVGVSPEAEGCGPAYRTRIASLISQGWSFARIEQGRVVFKAEVACANSQAAQIQGVWVSPERRGEGLAASCLAAVVNLVRRDIAPNVSLYVNAWNAPARAAYAKVGFVQTDTFATIMF